MTGFFGDSALLSKRSSCLFLLNNADFSVNVLAKRANNAEKAKSHGFLVGKRKQEYSEKWLSPGITFDTFVR